MSVRPRAPSIAVALAVSSIPFCARAQEPEPWSVRVVGHAGYNFPARNLGKNVGQIQEIQALQVLAELEPSPTLSAGVEIALPEPNVSLRLMFSTTVGATSFGESIICRGLSAAFCVKPEVDASMRTFGAQVVFHQGRAGGGFRPIIFGGGGLRSYDFGSVDCSGAVSDDAERLCLLVAEIWGDPASAAPFLDFGFGIRRDFGRAAGYGQVQALVGPQRGGSGTAEGEIQNDILFELGLSVAVR